MVRIIGIFALDDRSVVVPKDWHARFRRAEIDDKLNARPAFGTVFVPWEARNKAYDEFRAAVDAGLEVETYC